VQVQLEIDKPSSFTTMPHLHQNHEVPADTGINPQTCQFKLVKHGSSWEWKVLVENFREPLIEYTPPKLISCNSMMFCGEGIIWEKISALFVDMVFERCIKLDTSAHNSQAAASTTDLWVVSGVAQAMLQEFKVHSSATHRDQEIFSDLSKSSVKIKYIIYMRYRDEFMFMDLAPRMMDLLLQGCWKLFQDIQDFIIESITVEQNNSCDSSLKSITHYFLLYRDNALEFEPELTGGIMTCARCSRRL
jgi:hypothetical protein